MTASAVVAATGRRPVKRPRLATWLLCLADFLRRLCEGQRFSIYRWASGYSIERLFPGRLDEPAPVDAVPGVQRDLLLVR